MTVLSLTLGGTVYLVDPNTPCDGGVYGTTFGNWLSAATTAINAAGAIAVAGNGVVAKTGAGTFAARTVTGTANQITVTNGDGVSANPTLSLPVAITAPGSVAVTTTLGVTGVATVGGLVIPVGNAPASADAAGTAGEVRAASGFIYFCVATDTWQRVEIATWT